VNWIGITCDLCASYDDYDASVTSSGVPNHAAVSVVLEEKKRAMQKKHDGLSTSVTCSVAEWEEAWCDELVGYAEIPFTGAINCTIVETCND
jgi:hypothetical protein